MATQEKVSEKVRALRRVLNYLVTLRKSDEDRRVILTRSHLPEELRSLSKDLAEKCRSVISAEDAEAVLNEVASFVFNYQFELPLSFWEECLESAGAYHILEEVGDLSEWLCRGPLTDPEYFEDWAATFAIAVLETLPFQAVAHFEPHISEGFEFYITLIVVDPATRICLTVSNYGKTKILGWTIPINGYRDLSDLNAHVLEISEGLKQEYYELVYNRR